MSKNLERTTRFFGKTPRFDYIPPKDRYVFAAEKPKYKFNVIGTGVNGCEHIQVTLMEGRATIHGVFDPNPRSITLAKKTFEEYAPGQELQIYDSLETICNDPEVDGLIISTPNYTHLDVLQVAIKSGKHIFLEKPMATTIQDAFEILKISKDYPGVLQIGLQYRFKAIYVEAIHETLERKSLGDIKMVSILEHRLPFLDKVNQWNKFSKFSGGTLVEKCCHYFDLMNMFAQSRPVKVYATGSMAVNFTEFDYNGEKADILDNALVSVEYANGVQASFNLCMFAPMFYEEVVLLGQKGRLKAYENENFLPTGLPENYLEIILGAGKPSRVSTPCYPTLIQESGHNGATFYEHINLIDTLDGISTNAATVSEGFWAVVVGASAEESVKTGQPVMVDEFLGQNGLERKYLDV
jgi:myo-inositol 2-dehydrogenase/D-chiro-inositol 1-dehydrogenase